jgi:ornithine cyclodeaminase/alanine dehydrogenase-like protein (mu-crystallin family)
MLPGAQNGGVAGANEALNIDEAAVRRVLRMEDVIETMERTLADFSRGLFVQPVRTVIPVEEHDGFLYVMPAYTRGALGAKLVTLYPGNVEVPTHNATILLFDPANGAPLASLEGRLVTEMRTAAVSAVATRHLALADARVLGILGAGVQAAGHLEALRLVRDIREVRVWSPRRGPAFAREHGVTAAASAEEAVRGADIVVTVTTSRTPVLRGEWLAPGCHVNAVGAPRPDWRELDDAVLTRATVYVDSRAAAEAESGDVRAALAAGGSIQAEIGEVVAGSAAGRSSDADITLFKSLGMAVEDVATADLGVRRLAAGG